MWRNKKKKILKYAPSRVSLDYANYSKPGTRVLHDSISIKDPEQADSKRLEKDGVGTRRAASS